MIYSGPAVAYLARRFSALENDDARIGGRVYGEEIPADVIPELDQWEFDPVICVREMGGRRDVLTHERRRFQFEIVAHSYVRGYEVEDQVKVFLEQLAEEGSGQDLGLKSANRESGPFGDRPPDTRRRTIFSSWIVHLASDLP